MRIMKLGITNFWRNSWLSFAATLIMTLTLIIITIFVILTLVIGRTTDVIRAKMDVSVYFKETATTDQIIDLQRQVANRNDVKEVRYISKDEAIEKCKTQTQCKKVIIFNNPGENPLPRSLDIKPISADNLDQIAQFVGQEEFKPMIDNISYQDNRMMMERIIAFTAFTKEIGWFLSIVFAFISIFVILNTVRLAIFTRRDEIEIMRLVGASDAFIKVPFVVEGTMYGFLATIFAMGLQWVGLLAIGPRIEKYFGVEMLQQLNSFFISYFWMILGLELCVGVLIGVCCSLISVKKYLKV